MAASHAANATEEDHHSNEEDNDGNGKRRRVQRACDVCRKKKIRCDGLQPDKGACSNCASYGHECTFIDATKRRAPPRSYVIALESRMERAEHLISQLLPNIDINRAIGPMPELPNENKKEGESVTEAVLAPAATNPPSDPDKDQNALKPPSQHRFPFNHQSGQSGEASDMSGGATSTDSWADEDEYEEMVEEEDAAFIRVLMDNVKLDGVEPDSIIAAFNGKGGKEVYEMDNREDSGLRAISRPSITDGVNDTPLLFYGKASGFHIVPHLNKIDSEDDSKWGIQSVPSPNSSLMASLSDFGLPDESDKDLTKIKFDWPSSEIQEKVVQLYFSRANPQYPILNEVVFRKKLESPDWKTKDNETVLLALGVFSIGSRYLTDVEYDAMPDLPTKGEHWASLLKALLERRSVPVSSKITYIQGCLLCIIWILATPLGLRSFAWACLGLTVRLLQDMGAHRKFTATSSNFNLLTEETYRRLWWTTYVLDRMVSADMGRPVCIQDEDTDIDDILLVDDQYLYDASEKGVKAEQPADKQSVYHGFLQTVRLSQILGRTLRTIYAISKSKAERGFIGKKWDSYIVAEIDKSLNKWLENVPPHLAYSPSEVNTDWLIQSSRIFLLYYSLQVLVHRPFVQRYKLTSPLTFHSLAIVSNSARSGVHVMANLVNRGIAPLVGPEAVPKTFVLSSSLLLISYSAIRMNFNVSNTLLADVKKGQEVLMALSPTWKLAKRMSLRLGHLLKHIESGSPDTNDDPMRNCGGKRQHGEGSQQTIQTNPLSSQTDESGSRPIRGLKNHKPSMDSATKLPLSTTELQGSFGNSPNSAVDQVAALSGWQQSGVTGYGGQPSMLSTSVGMNTNTLFSSTTSSDPHSSLSRGIETNQPVFSADPQFLASLNGVNGQTSGVGSGFDSNNAAMFDAESGTTIAGLNNAGQSATLDPNGALRHDAFLGGGTGLVTPGFEMGPSVFTTNNNSTGIGSNSTATNNPVNVSGLNGTPLPNDPLDTLSNLNSFWSDSEWMRAMQNAQM